MNKPLSAKQIIDATLRDIAPARFDLLKAIVDIEDAHLSDKGATTAAKVAAEIERFAKLQGVE